MEGLFTKNLRNVILNLFQITTNARRDTTPVNSVVSIILEVTAAHVKWASPSIKTTSHVQVKIISCRKECCPKYRSRYSLLRYKNMPVSIGYLKDKLGLYISSSVKSFWTTIVQIYNLYDVKVGNVRKSEGLPGGSLFPCSLPKLPYVPMFPHSECFRTVIFRILFPCSQKLANVPLFPSIFCQCSLVPQNPWETLKSEGKFLHPLFCFWFFRFVFRMLTLTCN